MSPALPSLVLVWLTGLLLGLLLTPPAKRLAIRCHLLDRPDGRRKVHARAVPVMGGPPLLLAMSMALVWLAVIPLPLTEDLKDLTPKLLGLGAAALWICAVGVADDLGRLRGRHKLLGQLIAASLVIATGVLVQKIRLFGWDVELGPLAVPFTLFLLLGAINSLNLLDGMDGLLASVALILCLALATLAGVEGHWLTAAIAAALAGALLGFLRYNFPPATVFLGDSGSMLLGLVVGWLAIESSLKGPATAALATPTALLAIPILDTLVAILRRSLTGRSLYDADRGHLHHCLLRRGLTARRALCLVAGLCLLTVMGALLSMALDNELLAIGSAIMVAAILVTNRIFGHAELTLARQRLGGLGRWLLPPGQRAAPREVKVRLQGTLAWQELWDSVIACARRLNLAAVRLDVNAPALQEGYHARWDRPQPELEGVALWRAEVPLLAHGKTLGRLEVLGAQDHEPVWQKIALLARLVEDFEATAAVLTDPVLKPTLTNGRSGPHVAWPEQVRAG
jgi:UDP-GlcNAc:undecaprenyl-phosphate GlcNAc-1-phosphate transferase